MKTDQPTTTSIEPVTAGKVVGTPGLFNLSWLLGEKGHVAWECMGMNRNWTKVRFARLASTKEGYLQQITCYVDPEKIVFPFKKEEYEEVISWLNQE